MDSNHRSRRRQIYSLFPLAAREPSHDIKLPYKKNGAGERNRTINLLITNQLLCLIELHQRAVKYSIPMIGASGRNRTTDTGIFSPLLYLLSYRSKTLATRKGLEPSTSSVTGWRTNHLYYRAKNTGFAIGGPSGT